MDDATTPNAFDGYNGGRRGLVHDTANVVSFVLCKTVSGKDGYQLMEIATIIGVWRRKREEWYSLAWIAFWCRYKWVF